MCPDPHVQARFLFVYIHRYSNLLTKSQDFHYCNNSRIEDTKFSLFIINGSVQLIREEILEIIFLVCLYLEGGEF